MFEVLMFLFENYLSSGAILPKEGDELVIELEHVGFSRNEIDKALDWLDGLNESQFAFSSDVKNSHSLRYYLHEETERLGVEVIGFLIRLEQLGIVDVATREIVIDRIMAFDVRKVDLGLAKWVTLMALFSQPDKKNALLQLQDIILADALGQLH